MYCELAAQCFSIWQSQGLDAAMKWCQGITGPGYEVAGFLLSQLCDSYEVEAIAKEADPFWIQMWAENNIPAPQPKRVRVKVRFSRIQCLWQYRTMISSVFCKQSHRPYRYSPKFDHFEIVDIHGDRHEIYTREQITVGQALGDISPYYSVHRVSGLA